MASHKSARYTRLSNAAGIAGLVFLMVWVASTIWWLVALWVLSLAATVLSVGVCLVAAIKQQVDEGEAEV
jgi:hypothetical protein